MSSARTDDVEVRSARALTLAAGLAGVLPLASGLWVVHERSATPGRLATADLVGVVGSCLVALVVSVLAVRLLDRTHRRLSGSEQLRTAHTALQAREHTLARRVDDLEALGEATRAVLRGDDARASICRAAAQVADALLVTLFEPDGAGNLVGTAVAGLDLPPLRLAAAGGSLAAKVFSSGKSAVVPDIRRDPNVDQQVVAAFDVATGGPDMQGAVTLPVIGTAEVLGVLCVGLGRPVTGNEVHLLAVLDILAQEAALALERETLLRRLAEQVREDPLTRIGNRRRWDERLVEEVARAQRDGSSLSLAVLDLDRFKAYNDSLGHQRGDDLLRTAASAWHASLRATDLVARIGGEEFGVLLPSCDEAGARRVLEQLRRLVPDGQTCSVGVAVWAGEPSDVLVRRADEALYQAKREGRDRIVTATSGWGSRRSRVAPSEPVGRRSPASQHGQGAVIVSRLRMVPSRTGRLVATLVPSERKRSMRHVGIREFKDHATTMLSAGETLVIERHGTPIGFFIPVEAKDRAAGRESLGRLAHAVDDLLDRTGLDEDQLVEQVRASRLRRN